MECGTASLSLNPEAVLASQFVQLSVDMSQSILKSVAVTHQGAVVHQSRGEVAVEAEGQDMSFSGAESHFVF